MKIVPLRSLTVSTGRPMSRLTNVPLALQAASAAAVGVLKTMISPRRGFRKWEMKRFASTRSESRDSHRAPGLAQCSVGSMDDDGIRYGFTTHALIASTIAIAPAMVTIQSIAIRQGRGSLAVIRSSGFREW